MRCIHPINVHGEFVPCGKCPNCRSAIRGDLSLRIWLEKAFSGYFGYFVTLTYSDEHLPSYKLSDIRPDFQHYFRSVISDGVQVVPCFNKKHCQDFIKRFREKIAPEKLRYFLTCEYGEDFGRSHYHMIMLLSKRYSFDELTSLCDDVWKFGRTQVRPCTIERIQYCTSYALKDADYLLTDFNTLGFPDCKPFRLFSTRPGLGSMALDYLNEFLYNGGDVRTSIQMEGKRMRIPRYYLDRIDPSIKEEIKFKHEFRKQEYQDSLRDRKLAHSHIVDSVVKFEDGSSHIVPIMYEDYSYDEQVLKNRKKYRNCKN